MLRKVMVVAALLMLPAFSYGYFEEGDKEITLAGSASNGNDFSGVFIGANGSLGYFITDNLELSLRQSLTYTDVGVPASLNGSTRVALDFHFDLEAWQPFVGGNFGYVYGDAVNDTFEAAPEAGVKYFVNSTTFIFAMVEYQFFFDTADNVSSSFSDGQFLWSLGLGFRF
jgi:outer membrane protein W